MLNNYKLESKYFSEKDKTMSYELRKEINIEIKYRLIDIIYHKMGITYKYDNLNKYTLQMMAIKYNLLPDAPIEKIA